MPCEDKPILADITEGNDGIDVSQAPCMDKI